MSLVWMDSFDWWTDHDVDYGYWRSHDPIISTSVQRWGSSYPPNKTLANYNSSSGRIATVFAKPTEHIDEVIVGYVFRHEYRGGDHFGMGLGNNSDFQVTWYHTSTMTLRFYRGNKTTLLWESDPGLIEPWKFNHYEIRVRVDNTSGEFELRLNGKVLVNQSNVDTQYELAGGLAQLIIGFTGNGHYSEWDDFYVLDKRGSTNNDFLGPAPYIETMWPDASGEHTEWYPSAGDNWNCVDDGGDINTADYVMVSGDYLIDGARDSYAFTDISDWENENDTIYGVCFSSVQRSFDSSGEALALMNILGEGEWTNSGENVVRLWRAENEYINRWMYLWDKNPSGEVAWTQDDLNRSEFGIQYKA